MGQLGLCDHECHIRKTTTAEPRAQLLVVHIFTNDIQNILESRILTKHKLSISPSNKVSRQKALLGLNLCTGIWDRGIWGQIMTKLRDLAV